MSTLTEARELGLLSRQSASADYLIGWYASRMVQSAPSKPSSICVRERNHLQYRSDSSAMQEGAISA
jgi:hypothetical protein